MFIGSPFGLSMGAAICPSTPICACPRFCRASWKLYPSALPGTWGRRQGVTGETTMGSDVWEVVMAAAGEGEGNGISHGGATVGGIEQVQSPGKGTCG